MNVADRFIDDINGAVVQVVFEETSFNAIVTLGVHWITLLESKSLLRIFKVNHLYGHKCIKNFHRNFFICSYCKSRYT